MEIFNFSQKNTPSKTYFTLLLFLSQASKKKEISKNVSQPHTKKVCSTRIRIFTTTTYFVWCLSITRYRALRVSPFYYSLGPAEMNWIFETIAMATFASEAKLLYRVCVCVCVHLTFVFILLFLQKEPQQTKQTSLFPTPCSRESVCCSHSYWYKGCQCLWICVERKYLIGKEIFIYRLYETVLELGIRKSIIWLNRF